MAGFRNKISQADKGGYNSCLKHDSPGIGIRTDARDFSTAGNHAFPGVEIYFSQQEIVFS